MVNINLQRNSAYQASYMQKKNKEHQVQFQGAAEKFVVDTLKPFEATLAKDYNPVVKLIDKSLSFLSSVTTVTGFGLGSAGLMYEHFNKDKIAADSKDKNSMNKLVANNPAPLTISNKQNISKNPLLAKYLQTQKISFAGEKNTPEKAKSADGEGEAGHINPKTPFGKFGLAAAKVGIVFSGIAGVFNGISMGLPLMAAGEFTNICASLIINKPAGYGLFSLALAAVFAGRALEEDPSLKLDLIKTGQNCWREGGFKGIPKFLGIVGKNMSGCMKEVGSSAATVGSNLTKLVFNNKERAEAWKFFTTKMFTIKSKTITMEQLVTSAGQTLSKSKFKSHPYFMHTASAMLAVGGIMLTTAAVLQNMGILKGDTGKKAVKAGFGACEVGGSLDNLSLSLSGLNKIATGGSLASGAALTASGLTMIAGQPNADKDYGRSLIWGGCAALFAAFAFERGHELYKVVKSFKKVGDKLAESVVANRQFEMDLTKIADNKTLNKYYTQIQKLLVDTADSKAKSELVAAEKELLAVKDKGVTNLVKIFGALKNVLNTTNKNMKNLDAVQLKEELGKVLNDDKLVATAMESIKILNAGDIKKAAENAHLDNIATFGEDVAKKILTRTV